MASFFIYEKCSHRYLCREGAGARTMYRLKLPGSADFFPHVFQSLGASSEAETIERFADMLHVKAEELAIYRRVIRDAPGVEMAKIILLAGLKQAEYDGHDMPKRPARDALALLGIPIKDQPGGWEDP